MVLWMVRREAAENLVVAVLRQRCHPDHVVEVCFGGDGLGPWYLGVAWVRLRVKASCFDASGGDACGRRVPLEGIVVVLLPFQGFG